MDMRLKPSYDDRLHLFGFNVSVLPRGLQFFICSSGVFIFYLVYGYLQEFLFSFDGLKPFGWYLTLVQFGFYSMLSMIEWRLIQGETVRRIPLRTYFLLAFLTVATMGLSNVSLGYLNYPTQVIFKCCKLIPVMIGGILIQGKRYSIVDFFACLLMSVGLSWFILADSRVQVEFNYVGVFMMTLALCADAAIGNVQEKSMKASAAFNSEVVLFSYGIGFLYILLGLVTTGNFTLGFSFYAKEPLTAYGYTFLFSLSGYLGICFVLTLVRLFGALLAVSVTTCRKAATIILSFLLFSKPFTIQYLWAGLVVLLGIALNVYQKNGSQLPCWSVWHKLVVFLKDLRARDSGHRFRQDV